MHHREVLLTAVLLGGACGTGTDQGRVAVSLEGTAPTDDLAALGRAIGDRRIVLLGENGHGVGEFSRLKVRLVEWLHREKGFDVVAFESGFWECAETDARLDELTPREALHDCLAYTFQHAELLPLFGTLRQVRISADPLHLAGIDIQAQGFDSERRPAWSRALLARHDARLADRVATQDSLIYLPAQLGGLGDGMYRWLAVAGSAVASRYDSAAALVGGVDHWSYRMSRGLVERLRLRADAEAAGRERPARYYELRDEWMAHAIRALADSIDGRRKVVVWLHNDHGRYGRWESGDLRVRAAGSYLRAWLPEQVFSVGFFMAAGASTDNGRTVRPVGMPPAGGIEAFLAGDGAARYLVLAGNRDPAVRQWADSSRPYLRNGTAPRAMIPAEEFDALVLVDSVGPPGYRIP